MCMTIIDHYHFQCFYSFLVTHTHTHTYFIFSIFLNFSIHFIFSLKQTHPPLLFKYIITFFFCIFFFQHRSTNVMGQLCKMIIILIQRWTAWINFFFRYGYNIHLLNFIITIIRFSYEFHCIY